MTKEPKHIVMRPYRNFDWMRNPLVILLLSGLTATLAYFDMEGLAGWSLAVTLIYALITVRA